MPQQKYVIQLCSPGGMDKCLMRDFVVGTFVKTFQFLTCTTESCDTPARQQRIQGQLFLLGRGGIFLGAVWN